MWPKGVSLRAQRLRVEGAILEVLPGDPRCLGTHIDLSTRCQVLEPRGDIHRVAHEGVLSQDGSAHITRDGEARLDPNVHIQWRSEPPRLVVFLHTAFHFDRRVYGGPRCVFDGEGNPENRHHAVTEMLVDGCTVTPSGLVQKRETTGHDRVRPLRFH